jgi:hypothetical protein
MKRGGGGERGRDGRGRREGGESWESWDWYGGCLPQILHRWVFDTSLSEAH